MELNKKNMKVKFNKDLTSSDEIQKQFLMLVMILKNIEHLIKCMKNYIIVVKYDRKSKNNLL